MAVRPVLVYPDPFLCRVAQPVRDFDDDLRTLVQDLADTMAAGPGAVGIAATQVGDLRRVVIVDVSGKPRIPHNGRMVMVNPVITAREGSAKGREGCLSVPDYTGNVVRAEAIRVHCCNEYGTEAGYQCTGYEARAVQHEIDHLDGLLFLDRLISRRSDLFRRRPKPPVGPGDRASGTGI